MSSRPAPRTVVTSALIAALLAMSATLSMAQTRVPSLEDLRRELAPGDVITLVPAAGAPVAGRLTRIGNDDIELRLGERASRQRGLRDLTIPLDTILSLERPRDPSRNGAILGAGVGAGVGGALFLYALAVDRNEIDEWAGYYAGAAAVCTGIGALIGWTVDAAHSKPHIKFEASSKGKAIVSVRPVYSRGRGLALVVSISR